MEAAEKGVRKEKKAMRDLFPFLRKNRTSHTKEAPFNCRSCGKAFQRADVKAAHEKSCTVASDDVDVNNARGRKRVRLACDDCRLRKIACRHNRNVALLTGEHVASPHSPGDTSTGHEYSDPLAFVQNGLNLQESLSGPDVNGIVALPDLNEQDLDLAMLQPNADLGGFDDLFGLEGGYTWPDAQNWFDDTDIFDASLFELDQAEQSELTSPTLRLTAHMQDYFDARSRPVSPSRNKRGRMWYSAPPDLRNHNSDVLKIFLELFKKYVPQTFDLFREPPGRSTKRSAKYIFAMAAVGGLFSVVPGSIEMAKAMYNDARRLLFAEINNADDAVKGTKPALEMVATFVLLNIYGLCSGNKRSYEFVEAFQGDLTTAVAEYAHSIRDDPSEAEDVHVSRTLEALYVLDCYRVVVMMRPPSLMWHSIARLVQYAEPKSMLSGVFLNTATLVDGLLQTPSSNVQRYNLPALASLAPSLWTALRSCQRQDDPEHAATPTSRLGRLEFVGSAMDKWAQLAASQSLLDLSMYHAMSLLLHTDIEALQTFVYVERSGAGNNSKTSAIVRELKAWLHGRDYEVACWHAESLMSAAETALPPKQPDSRHLTGQPAVGSYEAEAPKVEQEGPHVPYAIYYATLVLYVKGATEHHRLPASQIRAPVLRGERILSLLRVHVAKPLARVLGDLCSLHSK